MNGKGYIMDQTFVYFRRVNHSRVAPGVEIGRTILNIGDEVKAAHPDHGRRYFKGVVVKPRPDTNEYDIQFSDERVIDSEKIVVDDTRRVHRNQISNRGGTKMFFVSFIGTTADEKIRAWNSKFSKCNGTACKLQKDHRYCLFHEKNDVQQSFCNRLLQDFYILTPSKIRRNEDFIRVLGDDVPVKPEGIIEHQKRKKQKKKEALYALQYKNKTKKIDWQAYDAGDIQSYIANSRKIKYMGKRDYELNVHGVKLFVRIECTFTKCVAVSLSGINNESLRSLYDLDISDVFKETKIECLFNKTDTEADHALIFIPKDYFDDLAQDMNLGEEKKEEVKKLAQDDFNSLVVKMDDMNLGEEKKEEVKAHKPKTHKTKTSSGQESKKEQTTLKKKIKSEKDESEHTNTKVCPDCGTRQNSNSVKICKNKKCRHKFFTNNNSKQGRTTKKCPACKKHAASNRQRQCEHCSHVFN